MARHAGHLVGYFAAQIFSTAFHVAFAPVAAVGCPSAGCRVLVAVATQKKASVRFASLAIVREAMGGGPSFRRHIPPILFLLAITSMLLAA